MIRSSAVCEASEKDFDGRNNIVVVSVVTSVQVPKTEKELRRRDDDGFGTKSRNTGVEAYYLTDDRTAADLVSGCLFYSNVEPKAGQIMEKLKSLRPVVVHRSKGTNFGYRESNDFDRNCASLAQVMKAVFGAGDVRIWHFQSAHNDGLRQTLRIGPDAVAVRDYGTWYSVVLDDSTSAGNRREVVNVVKTVPYSAYSKELAALAGAYDASADASFREFVMMPSKPFSLTEGDGPEAMMEDLVQAEFDFTDRVARVNPDDAKSDALDTGSAEYDERKEEESWFPVYDLVGDARGLDVTMTEDGVMTVTAEFQLHDPLDSEFYEDHDERLGRIAANMPKGFEASFCRADDPAPGAKPSEYIGSKRVLGKAENRESGASGVEIYTDYDVAETLAIRKAGLGESAEFNPDDAKADDLDIAGDRYELERAEEASARGDFYEGDFPAWAVDYAVNAETGSVSRAEKAMVDGWFAGMERQGYDPAAVEYGEDEDFSPDPEFGQPCDCVKARIWKKAGLDEAEDGFDPVAEYLS